jgi:hypothetical protein
MNQDYDPGTKQRQQIDQDALNLGSQSAATTVATSTHHSLSHIRQAPGANQSTGQSISEDGNDKNSMVSAYSYRSDVDALRLLRRVDGRVRKKYHHDHVSLID